jgi:molecular chaperone Hsp33
LVLIFDVGFHVNEFLQKIVLSGKNLYNILTSNESEPEDVMSDYLIRGTAKDVRFFAAECTNTVRTAFETHQLAWAPGVVLGRLLIAGTMMGADLKNSTDVVTISINGDGPLGGAVVTARNNGSVKGTVQHPRINSDSVPKAIGNGILAVIRDTGRPYRGEVQLVKSDISNDLANYFMVSEQTPTVIGLGVVPDETGAIRRAGGFFVQLFPDATEETIAQLETNMARFPHLTDVLDMGYPIEKIMTEMILTGLDPQIHKKSPCRYQCDCSRTRFRRGILLLGRDELRELAEQGESVTAECHFCSRTYTYSPAEIRSLLGQHRALQRRVR